MATLNRRRQHASTVTLPPRDQTRDHLRAGRIPDDQAQAHITSMNWPSSGPAIANVLKDMGVGKGDPRGHLPADDSPRRPTPCWPAPDRRDPSIVFAGFLGPTRCRADQGLRAPRSSSPRTARRAAAASRVEGQREQGAFARVHDTQRLVVNTHRPAGSPGSVAATLWYDDVRRPSLVRLPATRK